MEVNEALFKGFYQSKHITRTFGKEKAKVKRAKEELHKVLALAQLALEQEPKTLQ